MSFGYRNEAILPITVTVPKDVHSGGVFAMEAKAEWLVCAEQCIPESGTFRLRLPITTAAEPAEPDIAALFDASDARRPQPSPWVARLSTVGDGFSLILSGPGLSADTARQAAFFPDAWGPVDYARPSRVTARTGEIALALEPGPTFDASQRVPGVVAITDGGGVTRWYVVAPRMNTPPAPSPSTTVPLWQALVFAFVGGLILNLMPCVFPILAMKATAVARLSGGELREVRLSALLYTLGILTAFTGLAALLLTLRAGGTAVGWGVPVPVARVHRGDGVAPAGRRSQSFGRVRGADAGARHLERRARPGGEFFHRPARGGGGDALHRTVHGCGDRRGVGPARDPLHCAVLGHGGGAGVPVRAACGVSARQP